MQFLIAKGRCAQFSIVPTHQQATPCHQLKIENSPIRNSPDNLYPFRELSLQYICGMKAMIIAVAFLMLCTACTDKGQRVQDLQQVVLDLHDSSMVKMDALYITLEGLKPLRDSLEMDSLPPSPELDEVLEAITQIRQADDEMMEWMANFEPVEKEAPAEESLAYLEEQKKSIIAVDEAMDASIENGNQVIKKYK